MNDPVSGQVEVDQLPTEGLRGHAAWETSDDAPTLELRPLAPPLMAGTAHEPAEAASLDEVSGLDMPLSEGAVSERTGPDASASAAGVPAAAPAQDPVVVVAPEQDPVVVTGGEQAALTPVETLAAAPAELAPAVEPLVAAPESSSPEVPVEVPVERLVTVVERPVVGKPAVRRTAKRGWRPEWAAAAHIASLIAGFPLMLFLARGMWFFGDEWDFIADRGFHRPQVGWMVPHNEHWQAIPIVIWRALYSVVALREYWPYLSLVLIAHLVGLHLVWRIARRCGVDPWVSTLVVAATIPLGVGYENLLWAFQIGFVGSVTFGLGAVLVAMRAGEGSPRPRDYVWMWLLGCASIMCSGVGVTMVVAAAGVLALRGRVIRAALASSVPAIVYAAWYVTWGKDGVAANSTGVTGSNVAQLGDYVWTGLETSLSGWTGIDGAGPVLLVGLAATLAVRPWRGRDSVAIALFGAAFLFFLIGGFGRIGLGVAESMSSRYSYIGVVLLLPGVLLAVDAGARKGGLLVPAVISVLLAATGINVLVADRADRANLVNLQRTAITDDAALIRSGAPTVAPIAFPVLAPNLSTEELRGIVGRNEFPGLAAVPPSQLIQAHLDLQVALSPSRVATDGPVTIGAFAGATRTPGDPGCELFHQVSAASVIFAPAKSTETVQVTLVRPATVTFKVWNGSSASLQHDNLSLLAGINWIRLADQSDELEMELPPGDTTLCNVAAA